ncbi:hypothetical protein F1880_000071 [Penicillium rolfsii]|nr:hypothetical protein F1880_000071 [Penicillium rolfsii]
MQKILCLFLLLIGASHAEITCNRRSRIVKSLNVRRNVSSNSTPLQVGNGNFAFGADITGLQTFAPFAIMSTWGWHNFSLPTTAGQTSPDDFMGLDWWTHARLVNYDMPNQAENDISNWLIKNPQRLNLARTGFSFGNANVTEADLQHKSQELDLWSGTISSSFSYNNTFVNIETVADPLSDTVAIKVESRLFQDGLGIFFDFPYSDLNKFDAPFVGVWNATSNHSTKLTKINSHSAEIKHTLDENSYYVAINWETPGVISGPTDGTHRYHFQSNSSRVRMTIDFSLEPRKQSGNLKWADVKRRSESWWQSYWCKGAFIDLSAAAAVNRSAAELQRRTILSQYLVAVNEASSNPPQESGLVNNGWYGKFHLEMTLWHLAQFARWNHFDLLERSIPSIYERLLPSSISRAKEQGYSGARWGKMTDPTGRSAPGEINALLIWQQPHPMYFAELEHRAYPGKATLAKWDAVITASADFMASFAWWNTSTAVYDLGPPMYPVSENTSPNVTVNPTFELAYWRFGLDIAVRWKERQGQSAPKLWTQVLENLAPLPIVDDAYAVYEGIPDMWTSNDTTNDHPAMTGIYGLLPPPSTGSPINLTVAQNTAVKVKELWALEDSYGWDFSMLALNSLRLGDVEQAVAYLLDPRFQFDDAGYPEGGSRVPTPYMPDAASLLLTMAMMAGGWDGASGTHFPDDWPVEVDGFSPAM